MIIYFICCSTSVLSLAVSQKLYNRNYNKLYPIFIALSFLPVFIISGFRYRVGTDFPTYELLFQYGWKVEPLFNLLLHILKQISNEPIMFFLTSSFLIIVLTYKVILNQSINWGMSLLLYFLLQYYFMFFNIVRQGIAVSIIFYSYIFVIRNNNKAHLLLVLTAILIHKSSIIMLAFYFICNKTISRKQYYFLFAGIPITIIIIKPLVTFIAYKIYPNYLITLSGKTLIVEMLIMIIINSILFLLLIKFRRNMLNGDKLLKIQMLSYSITFLAYYIPMVNRISIFFSIFWIISIPELIHVISKNHIERSLIYFFVIIIGALYFYIRVVVGGAYGVLPYQFIGK